MKTSIAATLSVAGVIAAGTSVLAVNSSFLTMPTTNGNQATLAPAGSASGGGFQVSATGTFADGTIVPLAYDTALASDTSAVYEVGAAGSVVVDVVNDVDVIVSVTPNAGWTYVANPSEAGNPATVVFTSDTVIARFSVTWVGGTYEVNVTSEPVATVPPPTTPRYDDDDDDDDEYEDHEDEDHDEDRGEEHEDEDHESEEDDD